MEIVRIGAKSFDAFKLLFTPEAIERLDPEHFAGDTIAFGAVDDGIPVGAVAVRFNPPEAEVISLYVIADHRKQGIGFSLVFRALQEAMLQPRISGLTIPYAENTGEDVYTGFFESLDFDIDDVGTNYSITISEALDSPEFKKLKETDFDCVPFTKLLSQEKNLLFAEDAGLYDYANAKKLREDLTFAVFDEDRKKVTGCIAFIEEADSLVLAWLHVEGNPILTVELILKALSVIKETESPDRLLYIPVVNDTSDKLAHHLFGDRLKLENMLKQASFYFEEVE